MSGRVRWQRHQMHALPLCARAHTHTHMLFCGLGRCELWSSLAWSSEGAARAHLQLLTEEQEEEMLRKESAHLPPRNVLVCWAVRDLVGG